MRDDLQNFNSIKVRLEQLHQNESKYLTPSFQFHKGAIRTVYLLSCEFKSIHFNSIKVRLEQVC